MKEHILEAEKRLNHKAIATLRNAIRDAEGMEVFALGELGPENRVIFIQVYARGNKHQVIAPRDLWEAADVLIHNHPSGQLTPSPEDFVIASKNAEAGIGFYIVDNAVDHVNPVVEPIKKRQTSFLDAETLVAQLDTGGPIARRLPCYESRPSQLELIRWIVRAFNESRVLAAEAGTGVGKSFAYILPALLWAQGNEERVIISTATINLQHQLRDKDIPLIASALARPVKTVLIKGRSNYLCRRRLLDFSQEESLFPEYTDQRNSLIVWADKSAEGSREDIPFPVDDSLWSRVCAEADNCLSINCPERERCFVLRVKRLAADAQLIIVNHHLLLADMAARSSGAGYSGTVVLPAADRFILDEAHTVADAATSFFAQAFSRIGALKQLGRLWRRRRGMESGLLVRLMAYSPSTEDKSVTTGLINDAKILLQTLDKEALTFFGDRAALRLSPSRPIESYKPLLSIFKELDTLIHRLIDSVKSLIDSIDENESSKSLIWETRSALRRLETIASVCDQMGNYRELSDKVCWMELRRGSDPETWIGYSVSPLNVAPALHQALFSPAKTVVAVSATLTTAGSFEYWMRGCGAKMENEADTLTVSLPSPFPYDQNVLLSVPTDAPLPDNPLYEAFTAEAIRSLIIHAGGSALVLFTSYSALRAVYDAVEPDLSEAGIPVLKQGDDDRTRLLRTFVDDRKSVLFGTDSFWEGVDAPGDCLRLVIICRLPFRSPNDPIYEARREAVEAIGGNAFVTLSLPEAIMKFKQGFGRLIRRSTDSGAVVVLDGRILCKRYGAQFITSLPNTKKLFSISSELYSAVERFLESSAN